MTFIFKSSGILLSFKTTFHNSVHQPLESLFTSCQRFLLSNTCGDSSAQSILGCPWEHFTKNQLCIPPEVYWEMFTRLSWNSCHLISHEIQFKISKSLKQQQLNTQHALKFSHHNSHHSDPNLITCLVPATGHCFWCWCTEGVPLIEQVNFSHSKCS